MKDADLRWYLERAHDLYLEKAVLLIDTDGPIDELIGWLNRIILSTTSMYPSTRFRRDALGAVAAYTRA